MKENEGGMAHDLEQPVRDLLCEALETELGGVAVYETAVRCAREKDLKEEWEKYLGQTKHHVEIVRGMCEALGIEPDASSPGREIVRAKGRALVSAMRKALDDVPESAQVVAAECIVDAETKDHMNWQLIGELAKKLRGEAAKVLARAHAEVEDEEDEHLYHTRGWCRELWLDSLGMPSVMPPPEEKMHVKTAIGAARAEAKRKGPKRRRQAEARAR